MTAAASCVGAMARSATWVELMVWLCASDQLPNPADATAAHMQSTPAINMASQYEFGREAACRVTGAIVNI